MRVIGWFLLCWSAVVARADEFGDLRLIQAQADLPSVSVWLDLPAGKIIKPEQFSATVGAQPAEAASVEAFGQTGEGVAYIFLVDVSKSLSNQQFARIKLALLHWLDGMGENDQAALITFGREVKQIVAFTSDQDKLNNAIDLLAATDMETGLYRGLLEAISLGRRQDQALPARRSIVILSDGIDDSLNGVTVDEVLRQTQEYRVPIYSIGFAAPPVNDEKREGLKILGRLSRQSGGYFVQAEAANLDDAYEQQHQKIMQAYRLLLTCPACVADGQSYRLNLTWSDGQQTLNDGLDIRLLPKQPAAEAAATKPQGQIQTADVPLQVLILGASLLVFLGLLATLFIRRLAQKPNDDQIYLTAMPAMTGGKPVDPSVLPTGVGIQLTVVAGMQKGKVYQLQIAGQAMLGRASACDLRITDDIEVSSQHALLQIRDGQLMVRDLNSTNGTMVNGVPINNEYPLRNGDLLLLGRTELRVNYAGSRG